MYRGIYSVIHTYIIGKRIGNFVMMKLNRHIFQIRYFPSIVFLPSSILAMLATFLLILAIFSSDSFFFLGILLFFDGFVNFFNPFSVDVNGQVDANPFIIRFADFKLVGREAVDDQFHALET